MREDTTISFTNLVFRDELSELMPRGAANHTVVEAELRVLLEEHAAELDVRGF